MFITPNKYSWQDNLALYPSDVGKSETLPDQHMSIQQMLIRHAQGLPQTGMRDPVEFTTDPYSQVADDDFDNHTYSDFDDEMDVIDHIKASSKDKRKLKELIAVQQAVKQQAATASAAAVPVNSSQSTT